jgi:uncharacterized protein
MSIAQKTLSELKLSVFDKLPDYLFYHNFDHTLNVFDAADKLCKAALLDREEAEDLMLAAAFHDVGYIEYYHNNESVAASRAEESLTKEGFSQLRITRISNMILCTSLSVQPVTRLEKLMCDSDMAYLADIDYLQWADKLLREWRTVGLFSSDSQKWLTLQRKFFDQHHYHTPEAAALFEQGKIKNQELLEGLQAWPFSGK